MVARIASRLLLSMLLMFPVVAQELETTVESEGVAVVEVEPAFVEFVLAHTATGATVAVATETALGFEALVKETLTEKALLPESILATGVRVSSIESKTVDTTVTVRFAVEGATHDARAKAIATLCDDMAGVATAVSGTLTGPILEGANPEASEQDAIARATENALYKADAAAAAMQSAIELVRAATVLETSWETEGVHGAAPADSLRLVCHARVKMVYKLQY